jgi:hypothetical protein
MERAINTQTHLVEISLDGPWKTLSTVLAKPRTGNFIGTNNVEQCAPKVLRDDASVQLIVFFAAISEILKREIYRADKPRLLLIENKGEMMAVDDVRKMNFKSGAFAFRMMRRRKRKDKATVCWRVLLLRHIRTLRER